MAYDSDVLVVGGGIVGLSAAYAITRAAPGTRVTVLEKESGPARHQTGRNSGVIHSGIYYRPGSLKARFAVQGAAEMVKFCAEHGIGHEVTGKLIVATDRAELPRLHALVQRGRENGIPVRELGPAQIAEREPHVRGLAAIHVGTTGVCDFGAVAAQLARLAQDGGTRIRYGAQVRVIARRTGGRMEGRTEGRIEERSEGRTEGHTEGDADRPVEGRQGRTGGQPHEPYGVAVRTADGEVLRARVLVNCAGLHCDRVARLAGDDPGMRIVPFRGEYYELAPGREDLVRGLVYPVPDPAFPFLGVHLTRGIEGSVHIGPNAVPALAREGYGWRTVRPAELAETLAYPGAWRIARRHWRYGRGELHRSLSKRAFTDAVRRLLPEVGEADLVPAPAGVRAQAVLRDGTLVDDFLFAESPGMVHVLNAPSPAATASLPIGREVARRALAALGAQGAAGAAGAQGAAWR
ncbi:L-2-hydroxyglutarate oxidase [Streptomyces sp. NPDC004647]|uniref:L-2-hydroxyglutarate oxidase n=1 Tax=Streptomyces sp. NPDC004647 TaxID=3154671 RepID=UPI0033ACF464